MLPLKVRSGCYIPAIKQMLCTVGPIINIIVPFYYWAWQTAQSWQVIGLSDVDVKLDNCRE